MHQSPAVHSHLPRNNKCKHCAALLAGIIVLSSSARAALGCHSPLGHDSDGSRAAQQPCGSATTVWLQTQQFSACLTIRNHAACLFMCLIGKWSECNTLNHQITGSGACVACKSGARLRRQTGSIAMPFRLHGCKYFRDAVMYAPRRDVCVQLSEAPAGAD